MKGRSYYDESEEVSASPVIGGEEQQELQVERLGRADFAIAAFLAATTYTLLWLWKFPSLHPGSYDLCAVAAGVRPPAGILPGLWTGMVRIVYAACGCDSGATVLKFLGRISLSVVAAFVYGFLRELLAFIMKARPQRSTRRTLVMQLASVIGTMMFVCSDPVWNTGQFFSSSVVPLALTLGAMMFFFSFMRTGMLRYSYLCAFMLGVLAAESPFGVVLAILFFALYFVVMNLKPDLESPFFKPAVIAVGKWHMTFMFGAGFMVAVCANVVNFVSLGGLGANSMSAGALPIAYAGEYVARAAGASAVGGWILWAGVCLMPFVVSLVKFPSATDEENFLSYSSGLVYLFAGILALSQGCALPELWFWTYFTVASPFLLDMGMLLLAMSLAISITVLGMDSMCRNHMAIARLIYGYEEDDLDESDRAISQRLADWLRRVGIVVVPAFCVLVVVQGRQKTGVREMLAIIDSAVEETVRESAGTSYMFSDGFLDPAVELGSRAAGGNVKCISLVGDTKRDACLRTRAMSAEDDVFAFGQDAGVGLKTWLHEKRGMLDSCSVQAGFDVWKRDGMGMPPAGGMIARPGGWSDENERVRGVRRSREIAGSMLSFLSGGRIKWCTDEAIRNTFFAVGWHIAWMCLMRSEEEDAAGLVEEAIRDADLAERLNAKNEFYERVAALVDGRLGEVAGMTTPREGLKAALARADFAKASLYADLVLSGDPEDADGNFAKGMRCLAGKQYSRAEEFFRRALRRRPDDAAALNNLAVVNLEKGRLDEADKHVSKALEILPDAVELRNTQKAISRARARPDNGAR